MWRQISLGWQNGLAIDYAAGNFYGGNAKTDKIDICLTVVFPDE